MTPYFPPMKRRRHLSEPALLVLFFVGLLGARSLGMAVDNGQSYIRQPSQCVVIPSTNKLCYNVGYSRMILPNLLLHESLDEVHQQAVSFVPLKKSRCHPHLQIFLCSLFTPVCLSEEESMVGGPIPPCRSLCLAVKKSCLPVMEEYYFSWPEMLNCSKFTDANPCVMINDSNTPMTTLAPTPSNPSQDKGLTPSRFNHASDICAPCAAVIDDTVLDNYCASEFVIKAIVKRLSLSSNKKKRKLKFKRRKSKVFKQGPVEAKELRRLKVQILSSRGCNCPDLDPIKTRKGRKKNKKTYFLVMGRKVEGQLFMTVIYKWPKNRKMKKLEKKLNQKTCAGVLE